MTHGHDPASYALVPGVRPAPRFRHDMNAEKNLGEDPRSGMARVGLVLLRISEWWRLVLHGSCLEREQVKGPSPVAQETRLDRAIPGDTHGTVNTENDASSNIRLGLCKGKSIDCGHNTPNDFGVEDI